MISRLQLAWIGVVVLGWGCASHHQPSRPMGEEPVEASAAIAEGPEADESAPSPEPRVEGPASGVPTTCPVEPPQTATPSVRVRGTFGRVGDATWAWVRGAQGDGVMTVGADGEPLIALASIEGRLNSRGPESVSFLAPGAPARFVTVVLSDANAPRVAGPEALPFNLSRPIAFAVGSRLAVFAERTGMRVLDRATGRWRSHPLGPDPVNAVAWCTEARCFVAAQTEGSRLRIRQWAFADVDRAEVSLVADEPGNALRIAHDGSETQLEWTHNTSGTRRARRVSADGTMPEAAFDRTDATLPGYEQVRRASTPLGTLELGVRTLGEGVRRGPRLGHRWSLASATRFSPQGGEPGEVRPFLSRHGGGLGGIDPVPIAGPGGFGVALGFIYGPTDDPTFWWLRNTRCAGP